jgi:hypothetical protein
MKCNALLIIALLCVSFNVRAQEISDTKFGKGMVNFVAKDSSFSVKFAPRFQFRTNTTWDNEDGKYQPGVNNMLIRRARLKFDGFAFSPKLIYKLELGLANRDIAGANEFNNFTPNYILDAVLRWNFYKNFELWVGQTKLPGNIERVISSGDLELIDRSILNSVFNIDRDIGFQLRHHANLFGNFMIREKFSFSQGEGRNVTLGNIGGHQYTGRLEFLPFGWFQSKGDYTQADLQREVKPKLMVAITYNWNNNAVRTRNGLGSYMVNDIGYHMTDITTIFVDAAFKYSGFSFMGEYANRTAETPVAVNSDGTPTGAVVVEGNSYNLQAGYTLKSNYEFIGRYSTINYTEVSGGNTTNQYTFGISKYFVGHKLKVQTDLTYSEQERVQDFLLWRLGFDIHF